MIFPDAEQASEYSRRTAQFALEAIRLYTFLPKTMLTQIVGNEMLQVCTAVGATWRRCLTARNASEYQTHLAELIQLTELALYWLDLAHQGQMVVKSRLSHLLTEAEEYGRVFRAWQEAHQAEPAIEELPESEPMPVSAAR